MSRRRPRPTRLTPTEIIDLVSSDEDVAQPRQPLKPRLIPNIASSQPVIIAKKQTGALDMSTARYTSPLMDIPERERQAAAGPSIHVRSVRRPILPAVAKESTPCSYRDTHASESDDDIPVTRKPGAQRRRVIVESDSSDDQGGSCAPAGNRIVTSQRSRRSSADNSHESSSTCEIEQEYNLHKHYDSSIGSLRDFIISDSDCDSIESGYEPKGSIIPDDPSAIFDRIGSPELDFSRLAISHTTSLTEVNGRTDYKATAQRIFDELNRRVFGGKLSETKLEWNNRLLTTAGQAKCKRADDRNHKPRIILSTKVLTGESQILNTVAHEMCHVACWIIDDQWSSPHGKVFKSWGRKVMKARPDLEVTTTHNYTIEYKYHWKCSNPRCPIVYRRHSKSIDVEKESCWKCASRLEPLFSTKAITPYQAYLKTNMTPAKAALSGATHGDVMRALSIRWREDPYGDHPEYWRSRNTSIQI